MVSKSFNCIHQKMNVRRLKQIKQLQIVMSVSVHALSCFFVSLRPLGCCRMRSLLFEEPLRVKFEGHYATGPKTVVQYALSHYQDRLYNK